MDLKFSIRTLFVVLLLTCVVLGVTSGYSMQASYAMDALKKNGVQVHETRYGGPSFLSWCFEPLGIGFYATEISISNYEEDAAWEESFASNSHIWCVELRDASSRSQSVISALHKLSSLQMLMVICDEPGTLISIPNSGDCGYLEDLYFYRVSVNEELVDSIVGLPGVREVHCLECEVMDRDLLDSMVKSCELRLLNLEESSLSRDDVEWLRQSNPQTDITD
ncbi:hypothetical protein ACYFX5_13020 [Bremerella sp. T1]|uniref:hypothetical protein n=1 Tax=Bremerella sp. TYQ1 TaxID=3119568 RepID=UPI001CCB5908|nr:hypothetical protein [Bremerella volcania]UBM33981.1 hypothetical protein LA756_14965 [Bremerella volcania]